MKRRFIFLLALSVWLGFWPAQAAAAPESENSCIRCHEFIRGDMGKPVALWYGSTHQTQGISCDLCHGGDSKRELGNLQSLSSEEFRSISKQAMYSDPSFVGAPSGQAQFDLCAKCHADSAKTYAASIMGQAYVLKKGGPSCTQCHGAHRTIIPSVPESCKGCHQDTTGFDRITVMNIGEETVRELARIRIQLAGEKVAGKGPLFQRHLESFETGMVSWGIVLVLFLAAVGLYRLVERRDR